MIVSVGALADPEFFGRLIEQAKQEGRRLYVPSGAIGGLDIIKAAVSGGLEECRLTTTKSPRALNGAPYVREQGIDLDKIREATVIFEGNAGQAVRSFPQNVNVAATISLAGLGLDRTTVRIIADPAATRNVHEVFVRGKFGEATIRLVNQPSLDNPKSSYLASLSVIATLQCVSQQFQLGT
jgi:aspartate dehydrogenase